MNKPIIAVDMDDVLAGHAEAFVAFSNATYGTRLTVEDYSDHWDKLWNVEREEIERRAAAFHAPGTTLQYRADQSAKHTLKKLKANFRLVIVTARSKGEVDITYQWINKHFVDVFSEVHFVPIWEINNRTTKADICRQIGAQYLVDDLAQHCNTAAEAGITALLFGDYPWNRGVAIAQGVRRVRGWQEVEEFFDGRNG
ncbi:MAG TPA: hypothetical protein VHD60_00990 [Candidatus Saccharimonadales bacterium]|nr:hypothetical protein [Candidatus Saccharimonadales bacterium]